MEAANRGAYKLAANRVGLQSKFPRAVRDSYISPELSFNFHYFSCANRVPRKSPKPFIVFPGGVGPFDELGN